MPGKLREPQVVTDYHGDPVCILPRGFYLEGDRWEAIWALHERVRRPLTSADLLELFPNEPALRGDDSATVGDPQASIAAASAKEKGPRKVD